jgi:hypothetical protein
MEIFMGSLSLPISLGRKLLGEHRHICAFFGSPKEEYDTLMPFICDGLNCGQRAFHVLPSKYRDEHLGQLRRAGIDTEATQTSGQLEIASPENTYLKGGRFDKDAMLVTIQDALKDGKAKGFPLTRMIAHAETAVDDWASGRAWVEYEMRLNEVLPLYDDVVICTYDANLLTGSLAMDIMRTHPLAIVGGILYENPYFSKPAEFLLELSQRVENQHRAYRG